MIGFKEVDGTCRSLSFLIVIDTDDFLSTSIIIFTIVIINYNNIFILLSYIHRCIYKCRYGIC